jgi:hypothetical protein
MSYLGIIIEQSLKDITIINDYTLIAHKQVGNWRLFLVSVPANEVEGHLKKLQESMIDISDDCWYAHFFSQETMVVVYQSTLFKTTIFPKDWDDAISSRLSEVLLQKIFTYHMRY